MTYRESKRFERALNLVANERGMTRRQVLAWIGDDKEWAEPLRWPTEHRHDPSAPRPFMQVTRRSFVEIPK